MAGNTSGWFLITAVISNTLGIIIVKILNAVVGAEFSQKVWGGWAVPAVTKNWINLIFKKTIDTAAKSQVLLGVICVLLLAITTIRMGDKAKAFNAFFSTFSEVLFSLVRIIMEASPVDVFTLIAGVIIKYGWDGNYVLFDVSLAIY